MLQVALDQMVEVSNPEFLNLEKVMLTKTLLETLIVRIVDPPSFLLKILDTDDEIGEVFPVSSRSGFHQE